MFYFDNKAPKSIVSAIRFQYVLILISVLGAGIDWMLGFMTFGNFFLQLIGELFFMVFPNMIMRGFDFFRFLYVVLELVSVALFVTGSQVIPTPFSLIAFYIQMPLLGYTIYLLFIKDSNDWFSKQATLRNKKTAS